MFEFTTLFCTIDDFFQKNEAIYWQYLKQENPKVRQRSGVLCLSEIIFIAVWYKNSQLHHFKAFYGMIQRFYYKLFNALSSYQRMVHLINQHQLALQALHISLTSSAQTACAWVDSTTLPVCKNQRIQRHKSLKKIATRAKSSMGWFYGCKLHVLVDAQGQFIQTQLSNGHTSDIKILPKLAQGYIGKIFGDRGYISETLKEKLVKQDIELITYHRKNMRPVKLSSEDEMMLRQRNKIETIFSLLKQQYNLVSSRHRSISGYLAGIYASLCAYQICHHNKPQFTTM
jgi:hypothetical protein